MRRAIILGGSGFIGRALGRRLASAAIQVHAFSSATLDLTRPDALACLDALAGPETDLVHLAARTPDRGATTRAGFAANVAMATNVAAWLETHDVRSCVFVSTDVVYSAKGGAPITEETAIADLDERSPRTTLYAASKLAGERVLASVADERAIPLLVVRPSAIFGAGDTHDAYGPNLFVKTILGEGRVRLFGDGEDVRDHLHVDDLADALALLLERRHVGVLNLASGTGRTFASIIEDLRAIAPPFVVEHVERKVPLVHRTFDVAALRRALPELRPRPFAEALRATVARGAVE